MGKKHGQGTYTYGKGKWEGDKYDYSLVEYVDVDTDVQIICKKDGHGVFTHRR